MLRRSVASATLTAARMGCVPQTSCHGGTTDTNSDRAVGTDKQPSRERQMLAVHGYARARLLSRSGLCPANSDASSMRGGRSTRASHQSRIGRLTPTAADARASARPSRSRPSITAPAGTARRSRQPDPTQVSGLIAAQLRAWSHEIAANRWYGQSVEIPTADDQRRSWLISHVARRRSRITCKTGSFGRKLLLR